MHDRLQRVCQAFAQWCDANGVEYVNVCREDNLQGFMLARRHRNLTKRLLEFLQPTILANKVFSRTHRTRSGDILAFSLQSIAESWVLDMVPDVDKSRLARRLDAVMNATYVGQYLEEQFEGLEGIAADAQPDQVLKSIDAAMRQLNLHDQLKAAGITNKLSKDRQLLHFYLTDADGKERNIATYELAEIGKPANLTKMLDEIHDLAHQQSPGTGERERKRVQDQQKELHQIAKQHAVDSGEDEAAAAATVVPVESFEDKVTQALLEDDDMVLREDIITAVFVMPMMMLIVGVTATKALEASIEAAPTVLVKIGRMLRWTLFRAIPTVVKSTFGVSWWALKSVYRLATTGNETRVEELTRKGEQLMGEAPEMLKPELQALLSSCQAVVDATQKGEGAAREAHSLVAANAERLQRKIAMLAQELPEEAERFAQLLTA